jgi:hypothetical protein
MARRKARVIQLTPDTVRQPSGLKADGTPNAYWRRFEKRLQEFEDVPLEEWKEEQVLGYLLKRYRENYGIDFSLSYSNPPTKCPEMYCVRRMLTAIGAYDGSAPNKIKAHVIKQYIDWVFDTIISPQKTQIKNLAYFFTQNICNQFKAVYKKNKTITRSTELPGNYLDAAIALDVNVRTYGDLAFAKMAIDQAPDRDDLSSYTQLFSRLRDIGFDDSILTRLEE